MNGYDETRDTLRMALSDAKTRGLRVSHIFFEYEFRTTKLVAVCPIGALLLKNGYDHLDLGVTEDPGPMSAAIELLGLNHDDVWSIVSGWDGSDSRDMSRWYGLGVALYREFAMG